MKADYVSLSVVGVEVPHFHIHLIPRRHDDGLAGFWPTKTYGEGEMAATAAKIKKEID
jgi:histidine triad (HIT) family protein